MRKVALCSLALHMHLSFVLPSLYPKYNKMLLVNVAIFVGKRTVVLFFSMRSYTRYAQNSNYANIWPLILSLSLLYVQINSCAKNTL